MYCVQRLVTIYCCLHVPDCSVGPNHYFQYLVAVWFHNHMIDVQNAKQ